MAFNMKRPIIKGTKLHKASVAKAKSDSIVSQSRTTADKSLVEAGKSLGQSYISEAIDYSIDMPEIKVSKKKKKKLTKEEQAAIDAAKQKRKDDRDKNKADRKAKRAEKKRKKDLRKEYDREHPEGTLFPDGKYYDASGKEINGNIITRGWQSIKDKIKAKREQNEIKYQEQQKEKERIQAEKDTRFIGKGEKEDSTVSYEDSKEYKQYQKEQEKIAAEAKRKQMRKKEVIEVGKPTLDAFGGKAIANYNEEQKERLNTEGVFSEDAGRIVLPEEIVDGKFVSQATEDILVESEEVDKLQTTDVSSNVKPPEQKTVKKPRESKYKWPSGAWKYKGKERYEDDLQNWQQSQTPAQMRDNRIWRNAIKGGKVQQNMLKMGYTPPNER